LTTGVASAAGWASGDEVEESGATILLSPLFRRADETEGQSRSHGLGGQAGERVQPWLFSGTKQRNDLIPILTDDQIRPATANS